MGKDEFYSLDQLYEKHSGEKEVKKMISEGSIKVFREANQLKFKSAQDSQAENKKRGKIYLFTTEEQQYYSLSCRKFRQENWILLSISVFLGAFTLLFYGLLPQINTFTVWLDLALFVVSLAELCFLLSIGLGVLSNAFLSRFEVLISQESLAGDKKYLLTLFNKGYSHKQASKILWAGGMTGLIAFLFFYLAHIHFLLALCILAVVSGLAYWVYIHLRMVEKIGILHLPRKPLPILEEDISNVFPGVFSQEDKFDVDEKIILSGIHSILRSNCVKVRKNAIKALGKISSLEAIYLLVGNLGDPISEVRAHVISVLGKTGEKSVREPIRCLLNDDAPEVRVAAAEALGNLKDEAALDSLIVALDDSCPEVRGAAAEALGNLKKKKSVKPLLSQIKDKDWFVRHKVILALGKIKAELSVEGIEKLMQATEDENEYVSNAAKHVLKKVADDMSHADPLYEEVTEALGPDATPKKGIAKSDIEDKEARTQEDPIVAKGNKILREEETKSEGALAAVPVSENEILLSEITPAKKESQPEKPASDKKES